MVATPPVRAHFTRLCCLQRTAVSAATSGPPVSTGGAGEGDLPGGEGPPRLKLAGVDQDAPRVIGEWQAQAVVTLLR